MIVQELIRILQSFPQDAIVFSWDSDNEDFDKIKTVRLTKDQIVEIANWD